VTLSTLLSQRASAKRTAAGLLTYPYDDMESSQYSPSAASAYRIEPATQPLAQHIGAERLLTPREARLARVLADDRLQALLARTFGIEAWTVSPPARFEAATPGVIELRSGEQTVQLGIDLSNWPALASAAKGARGTSAVEAELHVAVASILLEPLRRALETLGMSGVQVAALHTNHCALDGRFHSVSFHVGERGAKLGLVHVDEGWLEPLEELIFDQCVPYPPRVSQLAVPGRIEIGARTLNIATLESLRPGDIVLHAIRHAPDTVFGTTPELPSVPIVWGNHGMRQLCCTASIADHLLTLKGTPYMSRSPDIDDISPAQPNETPVSVGELDLPVKIEIDTVSLPVAQLSALRAGYVLELPVSVRDAQVRLVSYGQTVAQGELVAVGDHIGVRILRMCNQSVPI
jgi:type III secretion protein Q